jgi:hypothetical protein
MKEYFVEYYFQGSSNKHRTRISARSEAEARRYLKEEKGNVIIHSTYSA